MKRWYQNSSETLENTFNAEDTVLYGQLLKTRAKYSEFIRKENRREKRRERKKSVYEDHAEDFNVLKCEEHGHESERISDQIDHVRANYNVVKKLKGW